MTELSAEEQCEKDIGFHTEGKYVKAVKWWKLAADRGHVKAQFNLGAMYEDGTGVSQSYPEAVNWYRKAAEQGHAMAQLNLGMMYSYGQGVEQDYLEAAKWYRLAADQGDVYAQHMLEELGACK